MATISDPYTLRYGNDEFAGATLPRNTTLDGLLAHRSVRAFLDKPLAPEILPTLVAAAQSAASSSNLQLWSVIAVEDRAKIARLSELAGNQPHIREAPLFLVWLLDFARLRKVAQSRNGDPQFLSSFNGWTTGAIDVGLAAQNAVVAAESLGLGTVYIGALRRDPVAVAAELELPQETFPLLGLSIGYPDPARPTAIKPRLSQAAVLHRERYTPTEPAEIDRYDERLVEFFEAQKLPHVAWSKQTTERLAHRDQLAQAAAKLGFSLG